MSEIEQIDPGDCQHWFGLSVPEVDCRHWLLFMSRAQLGHERPKLTIELPTAAVPAAVALGEVA